MTPLLADVLFWLAAGCCAVAELAIVRSVAGARRASEMVWAVLPALALAAVLALTWRAMHAGPDDHGHTPPPAPVIAA